MFSLHYLKLKCIYVKVVKIIINTLVTVALASVGKFPLHKILHYLIGQFLGAFVAAAVVYLTYFEGMFNNGSILIINLMITLATILLNVIIALIYYMILFIQKIN